MTTIDRRNLMKNLMALAVALTIGSVAPPSTWGAQGPVRDEACARACAKAYTPARGSATRKQIADAMRRSLGGATGIYAVFVFDWIKVNGNWAFAKTSPESADGENKYEPVWALLRRSNGLWSVKVRIMGDSETSPEQQLRAARKRFPSAPRDIFPR